MLQTNMKHWTIPNRYTKIKQKNVDSRNIQIWKTQLPGEDLDWDSFLSHTPGGRFEQTSLWAQVKEIDGWQPLRLIFTIDDEIVAGFQILMKKKPLVGYIGYVSKGPVVNGEDTKIIQLVVSQLKIITKNSGIKVLIVQPPDYSKSMFSNLNRNGFLDDTITKAVIATTRVNLSSDINTIFGSMSTSTKRNIRLGMRKGITIREGNINDLCTFFNFMVTSCRRQNVSPNPGSVDYFYALWKRFKPKGHVILLMSEYDHEDISGIIAIGFGDTVYIYKIGWSGKFGKYRPNDVTHWELIKFAKSSGYRYLDFVGIEPEVAEIMSQGNPFPEQFKQTVSSFKLGFGGEALLLSKACVYIYNPFLKGAYKNIFPVIKSLPVVQRLIHSV